MITLDKIVMLSSVLAALRPTTPEQTEKWSLTENALVGEVDGKTWFFDEVDFSGASSVGAPVLWSEDVDPTEDGWRLSEVADEDEED